MFLREIRRGTSCMFLVTGFIRLPEKGAAPERDEHVPLPHDFQLYVVASVTL